MVTIYATPQHKENCGNSWDSKVSALHSTQCSVIATVCDSVLCDYSILEICCSMKPLQDWLGDTHCSAAGEREKSVIRTKDIFLAPEQKWQWSVSKNTDWIGAWDTIILSCFLDTGDNLMQYTLCDLCLPALCRKKASSQHFSGLQRCGTCHEL